MKKPYLVFTFLCISLSIIAQGLPKGFVYISEIAPTIKVELRYITSDNFIGKPIDGYINETLITTKKTAIALKKIQKRLAIYNLSLKIFDAYRPQQSVDHFVRWANMLKDTLMKSEYYPNIPKSKLFELGYIAAKSGHTRGSTVDLTIIIAKTGKELDMGSPYDFFGEKSHSYYKDISALQKQNRLFLRKLLLKNGFKPYDNEWWHFTLKDEPFPNTYFNFAIQ